MGFIKFVALVAFFMFTINYAMGNSEKFYDKLREQAAVCEKGQSYDIEADGCRNTCECVTAGVMKCDDNECATGADADDGGDDDREEALTQDSKPSMFEKLRNDATVCTEGQEVDVEECGKCSCVLTGILNCRFKSSCLPNHSKRLRRNEVSNVIIG